MNMIHFALPEFSDHCHHSAIAELCGVGLEALLASVCRNALNF